MKTRKIYVPSDLKLNINIPAKGGFNMDDCDFEIEVFCTKSKSVVRKKAEMIRHSADCYVAMINTEEIIAGNGGELSVIITAYVPDTDFIDKLRTEVIVVETGYVICRV